MKKIDYKSPEMVETAADVLGCRFDIFEILFAVATGAGAVAARIFLGADACMLGARECVLIGLYGAALFLIFKTLLPFFLYVRVADVLRYRFAFYTICMAGVFSVTQSHGFHLVFAHFGLEPIVRVSSFVAALLAIFTIWTGSRALLSIICLACGAGVAYEPTGIISSVFIWAIFVFYRNRLHYANEVMGIDSDYASGGAYITVAKRLSRNMNRIATHRITGGLYFFAGIAAMMALRYYLERNGLSTGDWAKATVLDYFAQLKEIIDKHTLVRTVVACGATVITLAFIRPSTDVLIPLPTHLLMLYFIMLILGVAWAVGLPEIVPFLASSEGITTGMQMSDVAMGGVLVAAASVFLVEICCRLPKNFDGFEGFDDDEMLEKASQAGRNVRAFFFSTVLLAVVVLGPAVLARLHLKLPL